MRLVLVRHADPDYAVDGLTELGKRECAALSEVIRHVAPSRVYKSPLRRAHLTAGLAWAAEQDDDVVAVVLWIVHTYLVGVLENTPRLALLSPERGSGKTRCMEILDLLVARAVMTINSTVAYIFRSIDHPDGAPTLLFDEIDTIFGPRAAGNEELRGLINGGYRRGAVIGRCVTRGTEVTTEEFSSFAPVALAGLNELPDTIMSRSIVMRMRPRAPYEDIEAFRQRQQQAAGQALRNDVSVWARSIASDLQDYWPELPEAVQDRDADKWEPLIAVADAAGGHWPQRARAAAVSHVSRSTEDHASPGLQLLSRLRDIFGKRSTMSTEQILERLNDVESETSWEDFHGRPLTPTTLARLLKPYDVHPRQVRVGSRTYKGYHRDDLVDAWDRYLPADENNIPSGEEIHSDEPDAVDAAKPPTAPTPPQPQPRRHGRIILLPSNPDHP